MAREDAFKLISAVIPEPSARVAPIFIEETGYGAILNTVGDVPERCFDVPSTAESALATEDLEYLKAKGCFDLPAESKELIEAYFLYVHPAFPVIEASMFLRNYETHGIEGINLLLLWSVFSVSASYVDLSPQKAFKKVYAHRAKLLFDLTEEKDKVVLVQSALLLSFWFEDGEDVKQSWYWSGIAISVAQTLGLHRETESSPSDQMLQRSARRLIWQCCIYRDVWLAFGMGRPRRILEKDKDMSRLDEAKDSFTSLILHGRKLYSQEEATGFAASWKSLIMTSQILNDMSMTVQTNPSQIRWLEQQTVLQDLSSSSILLTRVNRHLCLHHTAVMISLAGSADRLESKRKAVDRTTAIIQALLHDGTALYAAPIIFSLLVPAMVIHLEKLKSNDAGLSTSGKAALDVYVSFLSSLEDSYPAATIIKNIFGAAESVLQRGKDSQNKKGESRPVPADLESLRWDADLVAHDSTLWALGTFPF
jgi:hypothetical protein